MNDLARSRLVELVERYGASLAHDPVRCEGLLRDTCPRCSREIFVLVQALRARVPDDLLSPRHALPLPMLCAFLVKRLQDEFGLSLETAQWAVAAWAEALGLPAGEAARSRSEKPAPPAPVAPDDPAAAALRQQWADTLEDGTVQARLGAVDAIARMGSGPENLRLLIGALADPSWRVRDLAFDCLAGAGAAAVPHLEEALGDMDDGIVWRAACLLAALDARSSLPRIVPLLERDGIIRLAAIDALGGIGSADASTPLLPFLNHTDPGVRAGAEAALRKIAGKNKT